MRVLLVFAIGILCFGARQATATYSDSFVRKLFPTIFAATEAKDAKQCLDKVFTDYELKKHINVACDETEIVDTCSGLTFVSHVDKAIVLAFRGTKGVLQLLVESDELIYDNKTAWPGGGNAGYYFARSFNLIWSIGMKGDFNTLIHTYPNYEIWIGGHSLGGSMAALASNYLVANKLATSSQVKLITFGERSPMLTTNSFHTHTE